MLVSEQPLGAEQGGVFRQALAVHEQVLPVHVDLDVGQALRAELVDDVQGHADVPHQDLHRRLGVLVLEEKQDPAVGAALSRLADSLDQPVPALAVGALKRIVVALDPGPDDEMRAELAGEVDRARRPAQGLGPRGVVGRDESPTAEARIEVQARRHAVHVVPVECVADLVQVVLVQLLRVVKLVAVDQVAEPLDSSAHPHGRRLARVLRLVAAGNEARHHRAERPDAEAGFQSVAHGRVSPRIVVGSIRRESNAVVDTDSSSCYVRASKPFMSLQKQSSCGDPVARLT